MEKLTCSSEDSHYPSRFVNFDKGEEIKHAVLRAQDGMRMIENRGVLFPSLKSNSPFN